jgi:hypothetical protein
MFATVAILIVLGLVAAALLAVALGGPRRAAVRLYCPVNETVVAMRRLRRRPSCWLDLGLPARVLDPAGGQRRERPRAKRVRVRGGAGG